MASNGSERSARGLADTTATALKVAVVGPVGVGKTTLVTSVSEIRPLTTEESVSRGGGDSASWTRIAPA